MIFTEFDKIPRLNRNCTITEKIDGTNAQVYIKELLDNEVMPTDTPIVAVHGKFLIYAGSRTRWITPDQDNYGFAKWVKENADELVKLGIGNHFGEWWGSGIQRKYGLSEKRFSLFNTFRWNSENIPSCCHVVPVLYNGPFDTNEINLVMSNLRDLGSSAAPSFMNPEGIIIYHDKARTYFKATLDKDNEYKGKGQE